MLPPPPEHVRALGDPLVVAQGDPSDELGDKLILLAPALRRSESEGQHGPEVVG